MRGLRHQTRSGSACRDCGGGIPFGQAVAILRAACPDVIPQTPIGRLDAIEKRLDAMIQAAKAIQPALQDFYGSLTDEQKSRFNTLGQQTAG